MKKLGVIFLGIGFGILCYVVFSFFYNPTEIVSPVEEPSSNNIIQQNSK